MAGKTFQSARISIRAAAQGAASGAGYLKRALETGLAREIVSLMMLLGVAFLALSIASFNEADYAANVFPANSTPANLGGQFGAALVAWFYKSIGVATYLLVALVGVWASVIFLRRAFSALPMKIAGAMLAVAATAGFFGAAKSGSVSMPSSGGTVGAFLFDALSGNFGATGAYLILTFVALVSVLLATDILFYPIVRDFFRAPTHDADEISREMDIVFEKTDSAVTFAADPETLASVASQPRKKGFIANLIDMLQGNTGEDDDIELSMADFSNEPLIQGEVAFEAAPALEAEAVTQVAPINTKLPKQAAPKKAAPKGEKKAATLNEAVAGRLEELAKNYTSPSPELLETGKKGDATKAKREQDDNAQIIVDTLSHFNLEVEIIDVKRGPTISMYELRVPPNMQLRRIVSRERELAMMLQATDIRILAPIPGRSTIGIEVPNRIRDTVSLREVVASKDFADAAKKMQLPIALGLDSEGKTLIRDLAKCPHLLISGTTGSGKSVMQNIILMSLLLSRHWKDVKLVLVDPKCVELTPYEDMGFLAAPVITDMAKAVTVFEWLVDEMERRYDMFAKTRTKKITEFNAMPYKERVSRFEERGGDPSDMPEKMPYIVGMVDELADLMMAQADSRIDDLICRVAQKARAAGIHLILATQRPSADVVTGLIKANVPARIAFKLPSAIDSRTIIGDKGAEKLLGMGDMLLNWNDGTGVMRAQSGFCDTPEIERVCDTIRDRSAVNFLVDLNAKSVGGVDDDMIGGQKKHEMFDRAVELVLESGRGSAQFLRSALRVGYNAATTIIMQMEMAGIVGPARGAKEREILISIDDWNTMKGGASVGSDEADWDDDAVAA